MWEMQGKHWQPNDRLTMVEFSNIIVVSVYHPVRESNGYEYELANIRTELDRQVNTVTSKKRILIGGDFNAQIGQTSRQLHKNANNGSIGFRSTNIQGEELQEWIIGNEICWVNSFFFQKKRGTWWNPSLKRWYEIDGFITKARDRHEMIRSFKVGDLKPLLSDHKPVEIKLKVTSIKPKIIKLIKMKQKNKQPNIKWERLMDDECANQFREKTSERVEKCLCENGRADWNQVEKILRETALEVCGKRTAQVNPWMEEHHSEVEKLKENIREKLRKRNEVKRWATDECDQSLVEAREDLKQARRTYKIQLKEWEEQWWDQKEEECRIACEEGKIGVMYGLLKQLQRRGDYNNAKNLLLFSEETFKEHLEKITKERFEGNPGRMQQLIELVEVKEKSQEKLQWWQEFMTAHPDDDEIQKELEKMRDSAPGEDAIRLRYIKMAHPKVKGVIFNEIRKLWKTPASQWPKELKMGLVIPLHKKGDRKNPHNYRGICLLPMLSRILARILATRLRKWAEDIGALDENQAGFRQARSTADATQIFVRLQEDAELLQLSDPDYKNDSNTNRAQAILLDLNKAYPRVNRPMLWAILSKYGLPRSTINKLKDLHEYTSYKVQGQDGESTEYIPQRGLREGCATSPIIFNIFHQAVMRIADKQRKEEARERDREVGVGWRYMTGHSLPPKHLKNSFNSEASSTRLEMSLFADDTTVIGTQEEITEGKKIIEKVMRQFEELTNVDKEENLIFGSEESEDIRMLGTWLGRKTDMKHRMQRAGKAWATIRKRFRKCRLSKVTQAKVFEVCIESTLLFNAAVRPFHQRELNAMQTFVDKKYRYIWSEKNGEPLRQMQKQGVNMADIRKELKVSTIRNKIEKAHLMRMGHILRMSDDRLVKQAVLGWNQDLEDLHRSRKKRQTTVGYWRRLLKEAGVEVESVEKLVLNRKEWKEMIQNRMRFLQSFDEQKGKKYEKKPGEVDIIERSQEKKEDQIICIYEGCGRFFRTKAGLTIHQKRTHRSTDKAPNFTCSKCGKNFKQEGAWKNHHNHCRGSRVEGKKKECRICKKWLIGSNLARHMRTAHGAKTEEGTSNEATARVYRAKYVVCDECGKTVSAANLARHQRSKACVELPL